MINKISSKGPVEYKSRIILIIRHAITLPFLIALIPFLIYNKYKERFLNGETERTSLVVLELFLISTPLVIGYPFILLDDLFLRFMKKIGAAEEKTSESNKIHSLDLSNEEKDTIDDYEEKFKQIGTKFTVWEDNIKRKKDRPTEVRELAERLSNLTNGNIENPKIECLKSDGILPEDLKTYKFDFSNGDSYILKISGGDKRQLLEIVEIFNIEAKKRNKERCFYRLKITQKSGYSKSGNSKLHIYGHEMRRIAYQTEEGLEEILEKFKETGLVEISVKIPGLEKS